MIKRRIFNHVVELLGQNPAVALMGPRQVGKTTLALEIAKRQASVYLDLEKPRDLARAGDFGLFHDENRNKLIILDEIQRLPDLFAELRGLIDEERRRGRKTGQFLFLGSASIELLQQSSETLAGRIAYIELHPFDVQEITVPKKNADHSRIFNSLWLRGGFPESYLAVDDSVSLDWRHNFIRTYLERDIPQLGPRVPAETLRRFWTMLAHNQSTTLNASNLARGLGISGQSVTRYLDLMVDLLLLRRLQPWVSNTGKRLVKSPKVYIRDSGITHALLGIEDIDDLLGHPVAGGSWEGFVVENILTATSPRTRGYFYRSAGGAEIDLVLEFKPEKRWAIEVKRSSAPVLSKGFHAGCNDVNAEKCFIVYPGRETYSVSKNTQAISLNALLALLP